MTIEIVSVPSRRRALGFEVFERRYQPVEKKDGEIMRDWNDLAVREADPRRVWTVVDGGNGELYVVPGFATVNYFGRVITRRGWSDVEFLNPGYVY